VLERCAYDLTLDEARRQRIWPLTAFAVWVVKECGVDDAT
jgi:hypothetical protein